MYVVEDRRINRDRSLPRQQRLHQELNANLQLHPHSFTSFVSLPPQDKPHPGAVPPSLPALSQVEEMVIVRVHTCPDGHKACSWSLISLLGPLPASASYR